MGYTKQNEDDKEIQAERLEMKRQKQLSKEVYYATPAMPNISPILPLDIHKDLKIPLSRTTTIAESSAPKSQQNIVCKFHDILIPCKCCGKGFIHSAQKQAEYALNGWCAPKRCPVCRHKKAS